MKLEASDKVASYPRKPHIKKGYYPAKLVQIEPFLDREGNPKESKFGRQLLFYYEIYEPNESGIPTKPLTYIPTTSLGETREVEKVIIPKFLYYMYRNKKTNELQTCVTKNSKITKVLEAHGWTFTPDGVDLNSLIGLWVEVNIDDYDQADNEEKYKASGIAGIGPYEGPAIEKKVKESGASPELSAFEKKKAELLNLRDEGLLTEEGCNIAIANLEKLNKQVTG